MISLTLKISYFLQQLAGRVFSYPLSKLCNWGASRIWDWISVWYKPPSVGRSYDNTAQPRSSPRGYVVYLKRWCSQGRVKRCPSVTWRSRGFREFTSAGLREAKRKKGLQSLQPALAREIAFCVTLAKLLCLINRWWSVAASGNKTQAWHWDCPELLGKTHPLLYRHPAAQGSPAWRSPVWL